MSQTTEYQTNVYNHMTNTTCNLLTTVQITSMTSANDSMENWTDTNELLTERQVNDPVATQNDDGSWDLTSSEYTEWMNETNDGANPDNASPELTDIVNEQYQIVYGKDLLTGQSTGDMCMNDVEDSDDMNEFISDTFSDPNYLPAVSSAFMTSVMGMLDDNWDSGDGSSSSAEMSTLSSTASLVSTNAQSEEQTGSTDASSIESLIQTITSQTDTISSCFTQVANIWSNDISSQNKI